MGTLSMALANYAVFFTILSSASTFTKPLCPELRGLRGIFYRGCECLGTRWRCRDYREECSNAYVYVIQDCFRDGYCDRGLCLDSCEGMYHVNGSRVCMRECPLRYYLNVNQHMCSECHQDCASCFGPSEKDCSACRFARLGRSCVSKCPVGHILDTTTPPATCIRPEECPGYIFTSSCVNECPSGFYPIDTSDLPTCGKCNSSCKTCSGPEANQCFTCSELLYGVNCVSSCPMNAPFIHNQECFHKCPVSNRCETVCGDMLLWNGTCVDECPASQPFSLMGVCQTSCPRFQHENKCVDACPRDKFQDGKACVEKCPSTKFIDGWSCVKQCERVSFGRRCKDRCPGKMPQINGTCVQGCPDTLLYVHPEDSTCIATCPYVIFREKCMLICPNNFFRSEDRTCVLCDRMCDGCSGPGPGNCVSCKFFNNSGVCVTNCSVHSYTYGKTCFDSCPPGTVSLPQEKICRQSCPRSFFNKTGSYFNNGGTCVSHCPSYRFGKACFDKCPPGTFVEGESKECVKCSKFSSDENCVKTCPDGSPYYKKGTANCLKICPSGTTHLPSERVCREITDFQVTEKCPGQLERFLSDSECMCSDYTARCSSGGTSCKDLYIRIPADCWSGRESSCRSGSCLSNCGNLYNIYGTRICVRNCPRGYSRSFRQRRQCFPCHPSCDGCHGPLNSHCYKCRFASVGTTCVSKCPTRYLNPKNKRCTDHCPYIVFNDECLLRCPSGYFRSQNNCIECDAMCETCHGPGLRSCDSCRHFNNNGMCVQQCPKNMYTSEKMCVVDCPSGTALYTPGKTCVKLCPNDMPFSFRQKCLKTCPSESPFYEAGKQPCLGECPEYTAHVPEDKLCRDWCPELRPKKLNGICVEECPSSKNITFMETCLKDCPVKTIIKAGTNICIPCPPDQFLYYDECVSRCPLFFAGQDQRCEGNFLMFVIWLPITVLFGLSLWLYKKRIIDTVKTLKDGKQDTDEGHPEFDTVDGKTSDVRLDRGRGISDETPIPGNIREPSQPRNTTEETPIHGCDNRALVNANDVVLNSGKLTPTSMGLKPPTSTKRITFVAQESTPVPHNDTDSAARTTDAPSTTKGEYKDAKSVTPDVEFRHTKQALCCRDLEMFKGPPSGEIVGSTSIQGDEEGDILRDRNSSCTSADASDPNRQQTVPKRHFSECEQLRGLTQGGQTSLVNMTPCETLSDNPRRDEVMEETFV